MRLSVVSSASLPATEKEVLPGQLKHDVFMAELAQLKQDKELLWQQLSEAKEEIVALNMKVLSMDTIRDNDAMTKFYTGFSSYPMLVACFNYVEPSASVMRYWQCSRTIPPLRQRISWNENWA